MHQLVARNQALEQREAERSSDHGRERQDLAGLGVEPIEARLERSLHGGRDGELVHAHGQLPAAVSAFKGPPLDQVADGLLEEEGVPARALGQELGDGLR